MSTTEAPAPGALFISPAYLDALARSGCAAPATGWTAAPLICAAGVVPAWLKAHSWGEFVFDFALARSYQQHGLDYYPKLVCAAPFTPVPGPRLLASDDAGRRELAAALPGHAQALGASGAHVLFAADADLAALTGAGFATRAQLRYVWENRGHADFDAFAEALVSRRRKNLRRERRAVAELGLAIEWRAANSLDAAEWTQVYAHYADTYAARGQAPYLNLDCLRRWAAAFGERMPVCLARDGARIVAMAFYFRDEDTLYGRHWGGAGAPALLHFELCYYQGIEHAIRHRLQRFDAGVQGEHKLLRGFEPELAYSAHWLAEPRMQRAAMAWFDEERRLLTAERGALQAHSAYRA